MRQVQIEEQETLTPLEPLRRILCCPTTRTPLSLVSRPELLACLSDPERGKVSAQVNGAFISETAGLAYPIVGRIISFLDGDALRLAHTAEPSTASIDAGAASVKASVKEWYDRFGWMKNPQGLYNDTVLSSQDTATGHGSYERTSHLSLVDRLSGGEFMLDAASGAIPHPEYLAYSWFYRYRICVDMSLTALQEADRKIGDAGFCCLGDITRLPLQTDSVVEACFPRLLARASAYCLVDYRKLPRRDIQPT